MKFEPEKLYKWLHLYPGVDKPGEEPGRSGWGRHGCWWGALVAHGTDHKCSVSITSAQAPRDFICILNVLPRRLLLIIAL